jgi:hypothetical protein
MHLIVPLPSTTDLLPTMSNRVFEHVENMVTCTSARERGADLASSSQEIDLKTCHICYLSSLSSNIKST